MFGDQYSPECYAPLASPPLAGPPVPPSPEYTLRHPGYDPGSVFGRYFHPDTLETISLKCTQYLEGVHPQNRPIVVASEVISHVRDAIFENARGPEFEMVDNVINTIVSRIRDEFETNEQNSKLTKWVTKYDEDPRWGLRKHEPIYARRQKDINRGGFMMNY